MLFNSFLFGTNLFGPGSSIATVYSSDRVVFDDFSLSDGSTLVVATPAASSACLMGRPVEVCHERIDIHVHPFGLGGAEGGRVLC